MMTLERAASVAQLLIALGTLLTVAVTLSIALRTFREMRTDRKHRIRPFVVFEPGGCQLAVKRREFNHRIGGVNPDYVKKQFADLAKSSRVLDIEQAYGRAINVGIGAALFVKTVWIPRKLRLGTESFVVDADKLAEPRYSADLNGLPIEPNLLGTGGMGSSPGFRRFSC